jgi:hypothetical protein
MSDGFVDLRAESLRARLGDNFWPSFTDIMTVVVMIFLMATSVVILRNWDLMDELRRALVAEREAAELARNTRQEMTTAEERLAQAQHDLSILRVQLMRETELNRELRGRLAEADRRRLELDAARERALSEAAATGARLARLEAELAEARADASRMDAQLNEVATALASARDRAEELDRALRRQSIERKGLERQRALEAQELADLRGEYEALRTEYDRLVRPARSAQGKQVVEVRYSKVRGRDRVELREPGQSAFRVLEHADLDSRLAALKTAHGNALYVKIIIPDDSGLSYSEAWAFTNGLLRSYDYYYQE